MGFVAIDFETANRNYNSACSIGLVLVEGKEIIETKSFLIQPPTLDFDEVNISIHNITPDQVKHAPKFPEVWDQIKHYFENNIIIAHNAQFDISVLKNCLLEYNLEMPSFNYLCSITITNCLCYGKKIGQSLVDRAKYFKVDMGNHHNALDDALTCAKMVIECINKENEKSIESFCDTYCELAAKDFQDIKLQTEFIKHKKFNKIVISDITAATSDFDNNHVLFGKNVVFTGELDSMDRKAAMQRVVDLGGIIKSSVSSKTNYLVVGLQDKSIVGDDGLSSKEEKAYELLKKGNGIKIISEDEFLSLI